MNPFTKNNSYYGRKSVNVQHIGYMGRTSVAPGCGSLALFYTFYAVRAVTKKGSGFFWSPTILAGMRSGMSTCHKEATERSGDTWCGMMAGKNG
jgi:hypothetical protein